MIVLLCCSARPTVAELACADDSDCAEWGDFAPHCLRGARGGVCSECAEDADCAGLAPSECVPNAQGFGTCLPIRPDASPVTP